MDASQRIIDEFDRFVALGHAKVLTLSNAEQVVYFVVVARCEADMEGFASNYEQALTADEMRVLIDGLRRLGAEMPAAEFARGLKLLEDDGFYDHRNWNKVSEQVKQQIVAVGECIGSELWGLDEKMVALLDQDAAARPAG